MGKTIGPMGTLGQWKLGSTKKRLFPQEFAIKKTKTL